MIKYRETFPEESFKSIPGTLAIHQVTTNPEKSSSLYFRNTSCGCFFCLDGIYDKCENINQFRDVPEFIKMKEHSFNLTAQKEQKSTDSESELNEEEEREWEDMYTETEAAQYIDTGDIAVIKTGDDHAYYLLKLTLSPFITTSSMKDDYNNKFPPSQRVVMGNYLEIHKETSNGTLYYVDMKREAMISAFCVVGNCPTPTSVTLRKHGKEVEMLLIDHDMHQVLCELVNNE